MGVLVGVRAPHFSLEQIVWSAENETHFGCPQKGLFPTVQLTYYVNCKSYFSLPTYRKYETQLGAPMIGLCPPNFLWLI